MILNTDDKGVIHTNKKLFYKKLTSKNTNCCLWGGEISAEGNLYIII